MFLSIPSSNLEEEVESERVHRRGGNGSKVPCNYCLTGQKKAIEWVKKKITVTLKEHTAVIQKCLLDK